jgi:hypothetical protein
LGGRKREGLYGVPLGGRLHGGNSHLGRDWDGGGLYVLEMSFRSTS